MILVWQLPTLSLQSGCQDQPSFKILAGLNAGGALICGRLATVDMWSSVGLIDAIAVYECRESILIGSFVHGDSTFGALEVSSRFLELVNVQSGRLLLLLSWQVFDELCSGRLAGNGFGGAWLTGLVFENELLAIFAEDLKPKPTPYLLDSWPYSHPHPCFTQSHPAAGHRVGSLDQSPQRRGFMDLAEEIQDQDYHRITVLYVSKNTRTPDAPGREPQLRRRQRDAGVVAWERANTIFHRNQANWQKTLDEDHTTIYQHAVARLEAIYSDPLHCAHEKAPRHLGERTKQRKKPLIHTCTKQTLPTRQAQVAPSQERLSMHGLPHRVSWPSCMTVCT